MLFAPLIKGIRYVRMKSELGVYIMGNKAIKNHKERTIIGFVREIEDYGKLYRVGIASGFEIYVVKLNAEGINLLYEVGNKVKATGIISKTKEGLCRIDVSGYEVYEMDEDYLEEFGVDSDYYFN
jgi:hypothetical protein